MLSFVIPVFNEADNIDQLFDQFAQLWTEQACELIFVNDGSEDGTLEALRAKKPAFPNLRIVNLSRNFGKDQALSAGLSLVEDGASAIAMDADGQHSIKAVTKIITFLNEHADIDIVFGTRSDRAYQKRHGRTFSRLLYRLLNLDTSRYQIRDDVGDFFIARPNVLKIFKQYESQRPFWKGFYGYVGFNQAHVDVEIEPRHSGKTKFGMADQFSLAANGLVAYAKWPLRLIFISGLIISLISSAVLIYILVNYFITRQTAGGFYTIVVLQLMFGGFTLVCLGIMAEYLGMIYDDVSVKPTFIIRNIE